MLSEVDYTTVAHALRAQDHPSVLRQKIEKIRSTLNPHPAGQLKFNIPDLDGEPVQGMQHKYRETVLFFPSQGQTCHAYCTFCFRWPQFVGPSMSRFAVREVGELITYLTNFKSLMRFLAKFCGQLPFLGPTQHPRRSISPHRMDIFLDTELAEFRRAVQG